MKNPCENCKHSFNKDALVCVLNPPTPIPIPTQNNITGEMSVSITSVFPPCIHVCSFYSIKEIV